MSDKEQVEDCYRQMYRGMIEKNRNEPQLDGSAFHPQY